MNAAYTIADVLAGSISTLLEQSSSQSPHEKILYMIYGYDHETYRDCWDRLRVHFGDRLLLASSTQLPGTYADTYPSGAHTMIHFRNISSLPVVCFHNGGEFEGYNTSFGKIERLGNHVTGEFAISLLRWLANDLSHTRQPQRLALATALNGSGLIEMLHYLFETVRPHLEHVVSYCNAVAETPYSNPTPVVWGDSLHLLGLFRDPEVFTSPSTFRRALSDNYALSQLGYWQRETNEHISTSSLGERAQALLLGVLVDPSRLVLARQELSFEEVRSLMARSRRSAEQIAQALIEEDVLQMPMHKNRPMDNEKIHALALQVFESFRNQEPPSVGGLSGEEVTTDELLQQVKNNLRRETFTAIQKALTQQSPIVTTNLFLGILRSLLAWKEEQDESRPLGLAAREEDSLQHVDIKQLTVQGISLLPHPSREKWTSLVRKIDQQIREQWKELLADTKQGLRLQGDEQQSNALSARPRVQNASATRKKKPKKLSRYDRGGATSLTTDANEEAKEMAAGEEPLLEQMHDLENGEPKLIEVSVHIVGSHAKRSHTQGSDVVKFHLEYDPLESLFLQHLVAAGHHSSLEGQKPITDDLNAGEAPTFGPLQGIAWSCESETAIGTDIRSVGFALVHRELGLQVAVPQPQHLDAPSVRELVESFTLLTQPMRERDEGIGYFSPLLLSQSQQFLSSYVRLLLHARQTEQDMFDQLYGSWIASLFTLNLTRVEAMQLTHIMTPFHPLQLRWRQTYERLLMEHIERCSAHLSTLTEDFIKELANLSASTIPGVLALSRRARDEAFTKAHHLNEPPPRSEEARQSLLSYPSTESKTSLFSGYKPILPRLQKMPEALTRKMAQFLRIYPSALDRVQISVIGPGDLGVEHSLSQMFENISRRYSNVGFFTRIFVPDDPPSIVSSPRSTRRRHYDEDQGELRARTRYHMFPRTEFVTLRQNLLKTQSGQQFLFDETTHPTQHLFILLDYLGVSVQTYEIPLAATAVLDAFASSLGEADANRPPDLSILLHQGTESYDELTRLWTRGMVDPRDAFSLLYYTTVARSQGQPNSLYRYVCNLGRFQPYDFGSDALIRTLHEHGVWVAIVDRAITREFFSVSSQHSDSSLVLIDFHKGIGPQREYNLTISSTWTHRVHENVEMALEQIAVATQLRSSLLKQPGLATAILRQFQNISGGLALQLAATDANTKGLLGLLVTAFEVSRRDKVEATEGSGGKYSYSTIIPLDDHNDWFERDEIRTDLLVIQFESDAAMETVHLYFTCIECKFDESVERASKGIRQLRETARRLKKRFSNSSPDYSFRLRDLVEAIHSLAAFYRNQLPESILDRLWVDHPSVHLHLEESEVSYYLALYQMKDQEEEVRKMCETQGFSLLSNVSHPFQHQGRVQGERTCVYRSGKWVGSAFEQLINWITSDKGK